MLEFECACGRLASGRYGRGVQRMNIYGSACLLGMLASVGLALEAGAMELSQQPAPATSQSRGFALPSFFDVTRLPDLQAAWREHFGTAGTPALAAPMGVGARDIAAESEQDSVRTRAEELSRRFAIGADGADASAAETVTATAPIATDATASNSGIAPTETASIHINSSADVASTDQALPRAKTADGVNSRPAAQKISTSPPAKSAGIDNAPVIEDMATKSVGRASRSPVPARRIEQPASSPTLLMAIGGLFVSDPEAPEPEGATMLPTELRSFGWSAQP